MQTRSSRQSVHSTPSCGREGETSRLVGWVGWNHLEQAHAIVGWYNELAELIPWLKQWHSEVDPFYDPRLGDFYEAFLAGQLHTHGLTLDTVRGWTPPTAPRRRGRATAGR